MSPPGNDDRRPPSGKRRIDERLGGHSKNTTSRRQKLSATPVIAEVRDVVGGTGRQRSLLIYRCPLGCGRHHVAHGRGELPVILERPAACGRGRVAILPAVMRGVA